MFSRQIEVCQTQNNVNKIDNFSREIEVCQNNANKSDNFSREIEVCQNNANKSDNFLVKLKSVKIIFRLHYNFFF